MLIATMGRGDFHTGGKHEGKRPLGIHRRRWKNNIKMDLKKVGLGVCTGLIGIRLGTGGRLVRMR